MKQFILICVALVMVASLFAFSTPVQAQSQARLTGGTISYPGEVDSYYVYGNLGEFLLVQAERVGNSALDTYIKVYDSDNSLIYSNDDSGGTLDSLVIGFFGWSDKYRIDIGSMRGTTGDYTLFFGSFDPIGDSIDMPGQTNEHGLYGTEGQLLIAVTYHPDDSNIDPIIGLVSPNGDLISIDDDSGGNLNAAIWYLGLPQDGQYTVLVEGMQGSTGDYQLLLITAP